MTIKHLFPTAKPVLDLNFARTRQLDPRITFTRTTTGTYVDSRGIVQTAAIDEPRFDHSGTGESLGLLIEEARTNIITQSEDLSTTWTNGTATLDPAVVDPAGNTGTVYSVTGERLITWDGGGASAVSVSVFIKEKAGETADHVIQVWQSGTFLGSVTCPLTGDFSVGGNYSNGLRTEYPNGWFRFSFTATGPGTFDAGCRLDTEQSTNYTWGFQVEAGGSFPTSYIPTAGATVTRAEDFASITGTNFSSWYNTAQSTWYAEGDQLEINANGNQEAVNSLFVDRYADISTQRWREDSWRGKQGSSAVVPPFTTPVTPAGSKVKTVYAIDGVNAKMCAGGALSSDATLGVYPGITELRIGESERLASIDKWKGHIARIAYYPTRLSDDNLQALTA